MLTRRAVVAAKIEAVEGTAETLAAADANFLVVDPKFEAEIDIFKRDNVDPSLSGYSAVPGKQMATLSFKVELKGSGTAGTAPAVGKLLKACKFGETIVAVTSATYAPISTGDPSLTLALYKDGIRKQLKGARGNVKYTAKSGEPGYLEFNFSGVYDGVTTVALINPTGIETTLPPALLTAAFTVQSYAAKIASLAWDAGNQLAVRHDINQASGYFSCVITGREMKAAIDPEEELIATHDWYGKWKSGALGVLTYKHDAGAGNICTVTAPKCQYVKAAEADRDGVAVLNLDMLLVRSVAAGDDEISIAFT